MSTGASGTPTASETGPRHPGAYHTRTRAARVAVPSRDERTPMLLWRRPTDEFIASTVRAQRSARFTYDAVGWTRDRKAPEGFAITRWREAIGRGDEAFERAKRALAARRMLALGWLEPAGSPEPLVPDALVCTLARQMGLYSLNVGRIVYVDDAPGHFAFGYGTLPEYPVRGEERFGLVLDPATGEVAFEIFSFSQPRAAIMRLAQPLLRRIQRRFCIESTAAMRRATDA